MINKEFLRYLDFFGTKCSFYTENRLKLYTPLGGLLSIASFVAGIFIFVHINMSSFKREDPTIITSKIVEENHKIKFSEEKIWIPWKISNYNNENIFNYSGILLPVIKYYYKENNTELESKNLSFRLCNETSMVNMPEYYIIDSSLDQLYCIDMDDLLMGGKFSTNSSYYYVQFNLYICKNGLNYDQNNNNSCMRYGELDNFYNNYKIIFYFPSFQLQEYNFETPVKIQYFQNYVLLSQNISKIQKLFLRKAILYDKLGLFHIKTRIYNYWAFSHIYKDFYFIQNKKNNSISKIYSFDIIIEPNTIYYYRSYKSIYFILAQSLPLIKLVHNLLKLIAKVFKLSSINRKMTELLFENLTEKPNKYENYIEEVKSKKIPKNFNKGTDENNLVNITNKDYSKNLQNFSSFTLFKKIDKDNKSINQLNKKTYGSPIINHKTININNVNDKNKLQFRINSFNSYNFQNLIVYKKLSLGYKEPAFQKKKRFVANKLFPFRYYFCAIFVKNIDLTKHRFCMSRKFIKVYTFLCQLFDISSYCILQKEFNIVKNSIFDEQKIKLIEQKSKINVNSNSFMREMNDCIGKQKFYILSKNNIKRRSIDSNSIQNFAKK